MKPSAIDPRLETIVKKFYQGADWTGLARALSMTQEAVWYQLALKSKRRMTMNFIGLLAVHRPDDWQQILLTWNQDGGGNGRSD